VDLLFGSRLPVAARIGSAGLLAGCCVDLPVHAVLYTNRKNVLEPSFTTVPGVSSLDFESRPGWQFSISIKNGGRDAAPSVVY
jgi:hypothetical protein